MVEVVVLRSDPAHLTRRAPVEPKPEAPGAAEEPIADAEAPAEPAEQPAPKARRRKKVAA